MAFMERSQFSKYDFADWAKSVTGVAVQEKSDANTPPRLRGMRMFYDLVNDPESPVNKRHGGWENIKTIRVLLRVTTSEAGNSFDEWKLDFILIKPQDQVDKERREKEMEELRLKHEAEAAAEAKKKEEAQAALSETDKAAKEKAAKDRANKKERIDRLRQLGKLKPFKKKTDNPQERKGKNGARPHH